MRRHIKKQPTLQDIGDRLGLTKRAVSQALNERAGTVKVSEATRQRVQAMAKTMGYRQNMAAKALTTGRTGMFGILSFQSLMHVNSVRLLIATEEFRQRNIIPLALNCNSQTEETTMRSVETLIDAGLDGVLLLTPGPKFLARHAEKFREYGISLVSLGYSNEESVPTYSAARVDAFEKIATHLINEGNKSLMLMVRELAESQEMRLNPDAPLGSKEGVKTAIRKHARKGIKLAIHEIPPEIIDLDSSRLPDIHPLYAPGYLAMREIIRQKKLPDALMCQVDGWAFGAMRACAEAGIRIPQDMAITGYSNDPVGSVAYVPLTTVAEPIKDLCAQAVTELLAMSKDNKPPRNTSTVLPCELIIRQSSVRTPLAQPQVAPEN